MDAQLSRIYYGDNPAALRGPTALYDQAKSEGLQGLTLEKVKKWLSSQPVYTLYRPARRNYPRRKIIANFPGEVVQIDIMVMDRFKAENLHSYVILSYDTYSKYVMAMPLKNRKPGTVQDALELMMKESPFQWSAIYWDKEGAFISRHVQSFLKDKGVHNYTTTSKVKAPGVERLIRTMRLAIQRHFEKSKTQKWEDYLPKFVTQYNNRVHSTTKLKPTELVSNPYLTPVESKSVKSPTTKLPPVGSYVRLNRLRSIFEKEASGNFTQEVFRVRAHKKSPGIPQLFVEDLKGTPVRGALYPQEFQLIQFDGEKEIDKVIKTRRPANRPMQYFVSYRGYPASFNEWISDLSQ